MVHSAPELEGVPGVKTAVADTGASSWCTADKSSILNYQELTKKVQLDGIAGGLAVVGKGIKRVETVTVDGKIKVKEFEVHHVPGLLVDLVLPQMVMKTSREGWFKINGEKTLLEFSDGSLVAAPFDPITRLPMFHFFDDAEAAAVSLETALHECVSEEHDQNLMHEKKETHGDWVTQAWL